MLEPLANLQFARSFCFTKVSGNTFDNEMVGLARLISVLYLEIAVVGAKRVKSAAARFLGRILQIANSVKSQHGTRIHFLRLNIRAADIVDHDYTHHDYHAKNQEKQKSGAVTGGETRSSNWARPVTGRFSRRNFALPAHVIWPREAVSVEGKLFRWENARQF